MLGKFECFCVAGYTGKSFLNALFFCNIKLLKLLGVYCETNIDECILTDSSPCLNNGICIDKVNGYECNCNNTGYTGPQCLDDIDECAVFVDKIIFDKSIEINKNEKILTQTLLKTSLETKNSTIALNCVHGFCTNLPGSYRCKCEDGNLLFFFLN